MKLNININGESFHCKDSHELMDFTLKNDDEIIFDYAPKNEQTVKVQKYYDDFIKLCPIDYLKIKVSVFEIACIYNCFEIYKRYIDTFDGDFTNTIIEHSKLNKIDLANNPIKAFNQVDEILLMVINNDYTN